MWNKPREIVRYLDRSPSLQFGIMAALVIIYFIQLSLFTFSIKEAVEPLLTRNGLYLSIYTFLIMGCGLFTSIYILTLAIWIAAKCFDGHGTLPQTRAAIIWTSVWSIPIGIFLLLIYFTIREPDHGMMAICIRIASYLGVIATTFFGFTVLLKSLSEVHGFTLWLSFSSIMLGAAELAAVGFFLIKFFS